MPKGYRHTEEAKRKMSEAKKGKPARPIPEEERRRISEKLMGHEVSEETRLKISLSNRGRRQSKEEREMRRKGAGGWQHTEETKQRLSKSKMGENNPNWKGGTSPENKRIRMSRDFAIWRASVFERDDYSCQICGERGGELHPHHLLPFADYKDYRFSVDNGLTLCADCHRHYHSYEKYLSRETTIQERVPEIEVIE